MRRIMANKNVRRRVNTPTPTEAPPAGDPFTTDPLLVQPQTTTEHADWHRYFYIRHHIRWFWAPPYLLLWLVLYCCIAVPAYHRMPKPLDLKDEAVYPDRFIAERAEINLQKLVAIGPRVVGSAANERQAVQYLMNNLQALRAEASSLYDIEADVQVASGSYVHWQMINMYQSVQNFVIKISAKGSNSSSYLLVNCHYDTVPFGPGAGDDGAMVAIMLETLRVLLRSKKPLRHPVVFLFNGAEENPLQASHAFITQHKWAQNVKALINLDSAGNGGREILFQSGPDHPWLMTRYSRAVKHPFASTVAEEMFQRHFIPSDTDFRIFRDHGKVPGLDMAHQYNGYVYHTRFDRPEILPRSTLQSTGDNVLALVREIANCYEMEDPSLYAEGHAVYFDVLGYFLVFYTETEGIILNIVVSVSAIAACGYSFYMMSQNVGVKMNKVCKRAMYIFCVQIFAVIAASTATFFVGILMDVMHMPMSWFTNSWLILGLYFCPFFFGFSIVPALYLHMTKTHGNFPVDHHVQLLLHCHCIFLALLTLVLTMCGIRSAFMFTICNLFYTMGLIINLVTMLHNKPLIWIIPHIICNILPFIFYAYLAHGFFVAFIPMTGRFGANVNPDLLICAFTLGVGILTGGFLLPLLNLFQRSKTIMCSLLGITLIFIIIAVTPLGFPYRPQTNVQRFAILHTNRVFHYANSTVRRAESGYFIMPMDRRTYAVKKYALNASLATNLKADCESEMFCGLPLFNHRWQKLRSTSLWIPGPAPQFDNQLPQLKLNAKTQPTETSFRYELQLTGPDHMTIFIQPLNESRVKNWSFHATPLRMRWTPPYFIYFSYGIDGAPLHFWLEFERPPGDWSKPVFEIGIGGHWNHNETMYTTDFNKFIKSFPIYVDPIAWPASYETWQY